MKQMSLRAHPSTALRTGAAKQSPAKRKKPEDEFHPFNGRLLRRQRTAARNDILALSIFLILLTSCAPAFSGVNSTPVFAGETAAPQEVQVEALPPTPEPFRLTLPTPGARPISGWRPPLYPVPWALSPYDHFYFVRPIAADEVNWPLPDYRYGGIFFANVVHTGIDIDADEGAPVYAAGPGTVVWAGWGLFTESPGNESDPYGLAVAIRHDFGYKGQQLYTMYGHMSKITTLVGQHVETGDEIGKVGSTGQTTGPHLHFEVRFPGNSFYNTYNPELWIAPPQGWGVLAGRVMDTKGKTLQMLEIYVKSEATRKTRLIRTYGGGGAINPDPYYNENLVLSDLPAGIYKLTLRFDNKDRQTWVEIFPGQVTYFTFKGDKGFEITRPPAPNLDFVPDPITPPLGGGASTATPTP